MTDQNEMNTVDGIFANTHSSLPLVSNMYKPCIRGAVAVPIISGRGMGLPMEDLDSINYSGLYLPVVSRHCNQTLGFGKSWWTYSYDPRCLPFASFGPMVEVCSDIEYDVFVECYYR